MDERSKLLRTLKVNGKELDPLEVMRECVYLAGNKLVEAKVANFFILEDHEAGELGAAQADDFLVSEKEVLDNLAPMKKEFKARTLASTSGRSFAPNTGSAARPSWSSARSRSCSTACSSRARLSWPEITKEDKAQTQSEQGYEFMAQLEKATEGVDENGNPKQLPGSGST